MMEQNTLNLNTRLSQEVWFDEIKRFIADEPANSEGHLGRLQEYIISHPLDQQAFALLAEVYEKMGRQGEAIVCLERALQLKELSEGKRQSGGAGRLEDLQRAKRIQKPLCVGECQFPRLKSFQDDWGEWIIGRSLDGTQVIRILIEKKRFQGSSFEEEVKLRKELGGRGCLCIVPVIQSGEIHRESLEQTDAHEDDVCLPQSKQVYPYVVEAYVPADRGYYLADIILGLLELRGFGIGLFETSTKNIQYDSSSGIIRFSRLNCVLQLSSKEIELKPRQFLEFLDKNSRKTDKASRKEGLWRNFYGLELDRDIWPLFEDDSFNVKNTHAFINQNTTGDPRKSYHHLTIHGFKCDGVRSLDKQRKKILEKIFRHKPEEILDLGCGSGQISFLAADMGHSVIGIDVDEKLMNGCQMLVNSFAGNSTIDFRFADLDQLNELPEVDTVLAMGILPHAEFPKNLAEKINASARKRIIVEGKPEEVGFKWIFNRFEKQSGWEFDDFDEWLAYLMREFNDFELIENHGRVDEDNWILEFSRKDGTR